MLENATDFGESREFNRWAIMTTRDGSPWKVIVEPLWQRRVLMMITMFQVEPI